MIGKAISHYKILENLGEGGMGVVYKAEDTKLKRTVALKFISPETMGKEESKTRFIREAQAVVFLDHPNICTIYEINEAKGQTFLAMSYIKGLSLKKKIRLSPLSIEEAVDIAMQVTEGLQEAHEKGIIHRDIKSSNIMITEKGQAKIMDFGLAKLTEKTEITKTATIMGTVAYMSPEQALGEKVDHRTDIWSFGVLLYEMLTGQLPFQAEHNQVILHSILEKKPKPVTSMRSGIPLEFEAIVKKCLEKDPTERYQTAADLKADLKRLRRDVTSGEIVVPTTAVAPSLFPRILKRVALPVGVVIIALLFLLVIPSTRRVVENWLGFEIIPTEKRLAILPFTVVGGDESDRAFCYGLVETMTSKLIQLEQFQKSLWVLPSGEVYENEITSSSKAHRVFRINLAVMGNFRRIGDMFSLTLNLVDTETAHQLESRSITDQIANISALQEGVVINLTEMLGIELQPDIRRVLTAGETNVLDAYESYLLGVGYTPLKKKEGDLDKAISLFEQAVEKDPHYALANVGLSKAYLEKYKETKDNIWIEKAQSSCKRAIEMSDRLSSAHVMLGDIYGITGRNEEAIKEYQQALQLDPENSNAARGLATIYENLGRLEEAIELLRKFIDLKPSYWAIYSSLGYLYYHQGHYDKAEKVYQRSTELMTENVHDYNNLMAIYFQMGKIESARAAFDKSVALEPDAHTYVNMGTIYFYQRRYADALAMFEEAIELGEDEFYVWSALADSCRFAGYKERAPEAYQHAIRLAEEELRIDPGNALLRAQLAVIYAKVGNHEKALANISRAKELAPNDVPILLNCILAFEIVGQRAKALQAFQEYMQLSGSLEEIRGQADLSGLFTDPVYQELVSGKKSIRSDPSSKDK